MPTDSVTPPDPPLVDPETGETPPLSPQARALGAALKETFDYMMEVQHAPRFERPALSSEPLVFVVDPARHRTYIEGSWDVMESDDAP